MKDADEDRFYELDYEEENGERGPVGLIWCHRWLHHNFILWIFFEVYRIRKIQIFFIRLHYIYTVLFLRYLSFCTLCKSDTGGTSGEKGDQLQANLRNSGWKAVMKQKKKLYTKVHIRRILY